MKIQDVAFRINKSARSLYNKRAKNAPLITNAKLRAFATNVLKSPVYKAVANDPKMLDVHANLVLLSQAKKHASTTYLLVNIVKACNKVA